MNNDHDTQTTTAGFFTLMNQATMTTHTYLTQTIKYIDEELGEGYAKKHPELMGQMIIAASNDYSAGVMSLKMQELSEVVDNIARCIHDK